MFYLWGFINVILAILVIVGVISGLVLAWSVVIGFIVALIFYTGQSY